MRSDRASAFLHQGLLAGAAEPARDAGPADPRPALSPSEPVAEGLGTVLPGAGPLGIAAVGLVLGLLATGIVVSRGWDPGAVAVGPWVANPQVGTLAIDPYARAGLGRSGAVPLSANEGLAFVADTDNTGYRLLRSCSYRIAGAVPSARFWSLTATGADGRTLADPAQRSAFTSVDVVRNLSGRFSIDASPSATPGNWLPLSGDGPLTLTLRLYDTPLAGNGAEVATAVLPTLTRLSCAEPRR